MNDESIYKRLLRRDQQALADILNQYGGLLKYIIDNTVHLTTEEMEECVSDVLFLIWQRIEKFDATKSSLKSWIILITRSAAIDYYRKVKKHRKTVSIEAVSATLDFQETFEVLSIEEIIELLQQLPPPDNAIFYDRFILGEDMECIADKYEISKDNAYKRIARGRLKLKAIFAKEEM
ncbi:sigma-70 family RNA polymerase sigma factor [Fusibacter ferrireducens]|uniref:Sigma-70 family RNA polymerase sigma factor n=1 Tax=Fusibacter ferrireducens TaxID=2785058 RepID=A0ABR9ZPV5_9FIRM|nr:sigma-70 family RNA polymerase sigma factor [Fusibacter ferrireducens]MBF4692486.1 sigma-70 family RNA polymerase sigma factor [Fusibacter ferrireducens]